MKYYIKQAEGGYLDGVAGMIKQLREAYSDPSQSSRSKEELLWLGRRYSEVYTRITGAPLPRE